MNEVKIKLLIIEDDEDMCVELKHIFEDEGFHVDTVYDGESGITALNENRYKVVLLDVKLPGMSGFEALKLIKGNHPNIRVAILTGGPLKHLLLEDEDELSFKSSRIKNSLKLADYVINKPFNIEKLISKVKELAGS